MTNNPSLKAGGVTADENLSGRDDAWPMGGLDPMLGSLQARYLPDLSRIDLPGLITAPELGKVAIVSSFGAESAALLHYTYSIAPGMVVLFLDTQKHFPETIRYRDRLTDFLGLNLQIVEPDSELTMTEDPHGDLHVQNPDGCCTIRKTLALQDALEPFDAWISGRKRFQGGSRANIPLVERDGTKIKLNPLAMWTKQELSNYFEKYGLPKHPLVAKGYPSIGCAPCTRPVAKGEGGRAGRWSDMPNKVECGIHLSPDGRITRSTS